MAEQDIGAMIKAIPQCLLDRDQWVDWIYVHRDGEPKPTKVPINAKTGEYASTTNPDTWSSIQAAVKRFQNGGVDGIGYVFNDDHIGIDLDNAVDEAGNLKDWATEIIKECPTYTEWSPSKTGAHLIVGGALPSDWKGTKRPYHDGCVEIYSRARFFTMTGLSFGGHGEPQDHIDIVRDLYKKINGGRVGNGNGNQKHHHRIDRRRDDHSDRLEVALRDPVFSRLWYGDISANNDDDSAADLALCNKITFYFGPDADVIDRIFRQSKLYREKWERADYRQWTISKAIEGTTETYNPSRSHQNPPSVQDEHLSEPPDQDAWPEPQRIESHLQPVVALPPALIPEPYRAWFQDISERMGCPLDYVTVASLVMTGSVIGAGCGIRPKRHDDWTVVPNLWGGAVGRPSIMLKTPAIQEGIRPLERLAAEAKETYQAALKDYEAESEMFKAQKDVARDLMRAAAKGKAKKDGPVDAAYAKSEYTNLVEPTQPQWRRYKTNDATVEKLGELLVANPRGLLVYRDELIGLLSQWDREGREGDRAFFLEAWNGNGSHETDRIGRGSIRIERACVSILGGIQPGKLTGYLYGAMRGHENDGLIQRLQLLVYPDEPPAREIVDRYPNTEAKNRAFSVVAKLAAVDFVQLGAMPSEDENGIPFFRFSHEAQEVFYVWLEELERKLRQEDGEPIVVEHLGKFRKLMPSLALIFHLIDVASGTPPGPIPERTARRAMAFTDYLESHARRIYGLVTDIQIEAAVRLAKKIREGELKDRFALRDVYRRHWTLLTDKEVVEAACEHLATLGWLRAYEPPYVAGRPRSIEYFINPRLSSVTSGTTHPPCLEEEI